MALRLGSNIDLDKVVKSLGQKYKLVPHLDLAIAEGGEFVWDFHYEPKQQDDAWHPSGDCTPTLRDLYLKAKGLSEPRPVSVSLRKTFMVGHFWHQYLQWLVQHKLGFAGEYAIERRGWAGWDGEGNWQDVQRDAVSGSPLWTRDPRLGGYPSHDFAPFHWATGSGDIAPCVIPGHGEFAVDFKTMNARMFATGPVPEYMNKWECQGNLYMEFFDMDRILFVGICKDSPHDMKEWEFERNQPLIDAIYNKWKLVSACLDADIEPPEGEDVYLPFKGPIVA